MTAYIATERDFDATEVTMDEIRGCSDIAQLRAWLDDLDSALFAMEAQLRGAAAGAYADEAWAWSTIKSMGFCGMGIKRIHRRLLDLGESLPESANALHAMTMDYHKAKSELGLARQFIEVTKERVGGDQWEHFQQEALIRFRANERARKEKIARKLGVDVAA